MHTLSLCVQVSGADVPSMGAYCARLANALVAVSGPEFTLGSAQYRMGRYGPLLHLALLLTPDKV